MKPFYDLIANIAAEEYGHIELVSHTINMLLTGSTTRGNDPSATPLEPATDARNHNQLRTAALAERGGIQWPCNDDHPDGSTRLYTDRHFPTEWQISESYQADPETGHEHTLNEYRQKLEPRGRAVFVTAEDQPPLETTDEQFPTIAISGRQAYHWHTRTKTGKAPPLHDAAPASRLTDRVRPLQGRGIRVRLLAA
jgi:predicted molibdopterin-dependent oxidoreductase YjgC